MARSESGPSFVKVYNERQDIWLWTDSEQMCDRMGLPSDTPLLTVLDGREDFPDLETLTFSDFKKQMERAKEIKERNAAARENGEAYDDVGVGGRGGSNSSGSSPWSLSSSSPSSFSSLTSIEFPIGKNVNEMLRFPTMPE